MTIETDRQTLDMLMAARPKVVFAESDYAAARDLLNGSINGDARMDFLIYRPASGTGPATLRDLSSKSGASPMVSLTAPPCAVCVPAALTDAGREQLGEFCNWWTRLGVGVTPRVVDLRNGHGPQASDAPAMKSVLYQHLFELARVELQQADARIAQLHGDLFELRTEYEQARGVMRRIQQFLPRIAPFRLIDTFEPGQHAVPAAQMAPLELHQPFPTPASGLAAIDLFSPPAATIGRGLLFVMLRCIDADEPIALWRIPYDRLGRGWFRCGFPVACASPSRCLELSARWETESGEPPRLALSSASPSPEWRCRLGDSPRDDMLAMTLWGTIPGTNLNLPAQGWCNISGSSAASLGIEYALDASDIAPIRSTVDTPVNFLHPLSDVPGFRLHPMEGPASGMLVNVCPANTDRVACTVQIRNPLAQYPIEFAMCLTPARHNCRVYPIAPENDPCVVGYSGWQTIPVDQQPHALTVVLDRPLSEPADLHFATRMKDGASIAYAWADWLEVRIRIRHEESGGFHLPESTANDGGGR